MVPWTEMEASALRSEIFLFLLHRTGLLPRAHEGLYPRIPHEWTANRMYSAALMFGDINHQMVDFNLQLVRKVKIPMTNIPGISNPSIDIPMNYG